MSYQFRYFVQLPIILYYQDFQVTYDMICDILFYELTFSKYK